MAGLALLFFLMGQVPVVDGKVPYESSQVPIETIQVVVTGQVVPTEEEPLTIKDQVVAAQKPIEPPKPPVVANLSSPHVLSDGQIDFLWNCESTRTDSINTGNGFYGGFQFTLTTWNNMHTGYARADLAPHEVQVAAVQRLLAKAPMATQFPGCYKKMVAKGLI